MNYIYKSITLFALLIVAHVTAHAQTTVSSIISSNQTWTASGSPYMVNANVLIQSGVKVTIEPGVTVKGTADRVRIIVDGELQAIGKKDSAIVCDSVSYEFTSKCVGFNAKTGAGSQFEYVLFHGNGQGGTKIIDLNSTSMRVKNCKFLGGYYNIYSYGSVGSLGDTTDLIVEKSIFKGGQSSSAGYMLYASGNTRLSISDCYADKLGGIVVPKWTTILRSSFKNFSYFSGIRQSGGQELKLQCNLFQNFRGTILDLTYPSSNGLVEVRENTFDSSEVLLKLRGGIFGAGKLTIKSNNFLQFKTNSVLVSTGSTPGLADTLDLTSNYWGTSVKADIELGIKDFLDDITLGAQIDFSSYLTSKVTTCSKGGTIGGADTTGINASIKNYVTKNIGLYPNPARTQISLDGQGSIIKQVRIMDFSGKTQLNQSVSSEFPVLDIQALHEGIYVIEIEGADFISRSKLVVKH